MVRCRRLIGSDGGVELRNSTRSAGRIVTGLGHIGLIPRTRGPERAMVYPFLSSMLLAVEAQRVVELRMVRLAWGGSAGLAEAQSMVVEKVQAAAEAMTTLMLGGSPEQVIARYREHVAFNTKRLTAA